LIEMLVKERIANRIEGLCALDGYDDNLNLVSSRTEDENPISPAPEK
jgi:hypothetical protein